MHLEQTLVIYFTSLFSFECGATSTIKQKDTFMFNHRVKGDSFQQLFDCLACVQS